MNKTNSYLTGGGTIPLTRRLLMSLANATVDTIAAAQNMSPHLGYATKGPGYPAFIRMERHARKVRTAYAALLRRRFIKAHKQNGDTSYQLTNKGVLAVIKEKILAAERLPKGEYCLVSFDFPVGDDAARNRFRRLLKYAGFTRMHQSLWASEHDVSRQTEDLLIQMKIGRRAQVFMARVRSAPR